jgi:O-acetyl-ADP-ribose deacetylase (regulator of RNase III)
MMKLTQGNLLAAPAEALVNTMNTVGIMGRGIALQSNPHFSKSWRRPTEAFKPPLQPRPRVLRLFTTGATFTETSRPGSTRRLMVGN